jgi:hypothetical protein
MDIVECLRACGSEVRDRLPEVNRGGCCVYAANVAMALEAAGLTVWGVLTSQLRGTDDLNMVREQDRPKTLLQWNNAGILIGHVMVQFELDNRVWTHDCTRTTCDQVRKDFAFNEPLVPGYITVAEMVSIAAARKGWNLVFNRRSGSPTIRAAVRRHLCA